MTEQELQMLLKDMSLQEKADQLLQLTADFYGDADREVITGPMAELGISSADVSQAGSILNGTGARFLMQVQEEYQKRQPHHIPLLFMMDVIHGYRTIFPAPLGQGASFDPDLARQSAGAAAKEAAYAGLHVVFSPMADLVRDPRWGRVMESTGEDPCLNSRFTEALVQGFQGGDFREEGRVCACVKHFAGYGGAEAGREYNSVQLSDHTLRAYYLPAYQAGIAAGAGMVMTSFNTVNDVPATISQPLMRGILREEMGFDGVLISDYSAIRETIAHGCAENEREAARKALLAGVDIDMMTGCYAKHLAGLIESGELSEALLDESVMRVLRLKNRLGLFEHPYKDADPEKEQRYALCAEHRALARRYAAESCVLLKNDGILPLRPGQKIALIGPYIDSHEINSSWAVTGNCADSVTIRQAAEECLPPSDLLFAHGTDLLPEDCQLNGYAESAASRELYRKVRSNPEQALQAALDAAAQADVAVLCIGEHYLQSGEAASRSDLSVPEAQMQLFRAVKKVNPRIAVVLFSGRPLVLNELDQDASAILEVWMPGTEGGHAIWDLLTGAESPSGKLPMSFPRSVGQIPVYYNHFSTGRPVTGDPTLRFLSSYMDLPNEPLYPFGYGLSYTCFSFSKPSLSVSELPAGASLLAGVTVRNTGERSGTEVVQLYIQDPAAHVARPVRELKDFRRVTLAPGEEQTVSFTITEAQLSYLHADGTFCADPGRFRLWIGSSSTTENGAEFTLLPGGQFPEA